MKEILTRERLTWEIFPGWPPWPPCQVSLQKRLRPATPVYWDWQKNEGKEAFCCGISSLGEFKWWWLIQGEMIWFTLSIHFISILTARRKWKREEWRRKRCEKERKCSNRKKSGCDWLNPSNCFLHCWHHRSTGEQPNMGTVELKNHPKYKSVTYNEGPSENITFNKELWLIEPEWFLHSICTVHCTSVHQRASNESRNI